MLCGGLTYFVEETMHAKHVMRIGYQHSKGWWFAVYRMKGMTVVLQRSKCKNAADAYRRAGNAIRKDSERK